MNRELTLQAGRRRRAGRLFLNYACVLATAASALLVTPAAQAEADRRVCSNQVGYHNGFFFSFWRDYGDSCIDLKGAGNYALSWQGNTGNVVAGKGWPTSARRVVSYSGSYSPSGGGASYLALYGWSVSPLVEYYIVDNWFNYNPSSGGTWMASVYTDGDTYDIYKSRRYNAPNITGVNQDFDQYWSVRRSKRTQGTITVGNHFDAWANRGMYLGNFNNCASGVCYQILATEGYQNAGSSNITVSEGSGGSSVPLLNVHSGKALDVTDWNPNNGTPLQQWGYGGGDNQKWYIIPGWKQDTWMVKSKFSGRCLSVPASSTANGVRLNQWDCYGGTEQLWYRIWLDYPNRFLLQNVNSNKCMDVNGASTANGAAVIQWDCHWGTNQQWRTQ